MESDKCRKFYNTALFRQCTLSVCISLSYFHIGLVRAYSSTAFPSMQLHRPELLPTKDIWSWAGSISPFGGLIGTILSGPLLHYVGRKHTVCFAAPVGALSWAIIAFSPSWRWLIAGRTLSGVCAGLCLPSAQIYVTECTDAKIRGVIGSFPSMSMSAGILVSYIMGSWLRWDLLAWVSCGVAASIAVATAFLPESPTWLNGHQRVERAQRSRKWLKLERGVAAQMLGGGTTETAVTDQSVSEMVALSGGDGGGVDAPSSKELEADNGANSGPDPHSWSVLLSAPILKPLGIGLTLLLIQQFSGIDAVIFFTVDIFRASGSTIDGNLATIIVGALQLSSNFASLFLVDRAGRKPLLIGSALVMAIAMALMGVSFYINSIGVEGYGFLPLVSLTIFIIGFSCGFGSIPFLLMGEIFPAAQRGLLSSVVGSFNLGAMFLVIKTYHPLEAMITTAGTFWAYAVLCAIGCVFVILCVPETKGRDTDEIAQLFQRGKYAPVSKTPGGLMA